MLDYIFSQDKEAKSGKAEEKESSAGCDLKGQEDPEGNEAGSKDEDSETDYSSEDEEILTKAGRPMLTVPNGEGTDGCVRLGSVGDCAIF